MPCSDSRSEPRVITETGIPTAVFEVVKRRLDKATRLLCHVTKDMDLEKMPLESHEDLELIWWIRAHRKDDASTGD